MSAIDKRVSSAKSVEEKSEADGKSLIYKMNNKRPSEEPCKTPQLIFYFVECTGTHGTDQVWRKSLL